MKTSKFGEMIFDEEDLCDLAMQGRDVTAMIDTIIDREVDLEKLIGAIENPGSLLTWSFPADSDQSVADFDAGQQAQWFMPDEYRDMDIAEHVLGLCKTQAELQRVGEELLLYQERNLFDLLRYLKYLVDIMRSNRIIWGVGRGSSVASYVLYLLGIHRIDSMYYDLDPREFLR